MVASVASWREIKKERRMGRKVLLVCGIVSSMLYIDNPIQDLDLRHFHHLLIQLDKLEEVHPMCLPC